MERKLRLLVVFVVLLRKLVCCWPLSSEGELMALCFLCGKVWFSCVLRLWVCGLCFAGLALLCFRDGVESDPHGVLASWGSRDDPCSWFGVGCSDGKVVTL